MSMKKRFLGMLLFGTVFSAAFVCGQESPGYSLDLQGIISLAIEQSPAIKTQNQMKNAGLLCAGKIFGSLS